MSIGEAVVELGAALGGDAELLPVWKDGETVIIQRTVNGQNVLMVVVVRDPSSLGPRGMVLKGDLKKWGTSSYADGRVANQKASLDRLMAERQQVLELAIKAGAREIVDLLAPSE